MRRAVALRASDCLSGAGEPADAKAEQHQHATGTDDQSEVEAGERQLAAIVVRRRGRGSRRGRLLVIRLRLSGLRLDPVLHDTAGLVVPALGALSDGTCRQSEQRSDDQRREKLVKSTHELWSPYHRGLASLPFSRKIPALPWPRYSWSACTTVPLVPNSSGTSVESQMVRGCGICTDSRARNVRNRAS